METKLDPMKCEDLKAEIAWGSADPFAGISRFFTSGYLMETKHDGCQISILLNSQGNMVISHGRNVSSRFPQWRDATIPGADGTVLLGEMVANGANGHLLTSATTLLVSGTQNALALQRPEQYGPAHLILFDILAIGEHITPPDMEGPVIHQPYTTRRQFLEVLTPHLEEASSGTISLVSQFPSSKDAIMKVLEAGGEGVVIKKADSCYVPGSRSAGWFKVKRYSTADGFVIDWKPGKNSNQGLVGSLILGVLVDGVVQEIATVGNLDAVMSGDRCTFRKRITSEDGTLRPEWYGTVIEFMGQSIGVGGKVRHPHMVRLRPDKSPEDCTEDQLKVFARG
jgi:bifunctional non-homologous end joining protein LigD